MAVGLFLLVGGVSDTGAPPEVRVSIAPVTASALPDGAGVEVSTPPVADGERGIAPVLGTDDSFLYGILTSNNNEVTVIAATATADIKSAPASDALAATAVADVESAPASDALAATAGAGIDTTPAPGAATASADIDTTPASDAATDSTAPDATATNNTAPGNMRANAPEVGVARSAAPDEPYGVVNAQGGGKICK
jgi:hypothetical protein